ncbi:MAG TPA: indole-3-glycerol phosphate synthase TrpC [Vicinamibacterales bacterium]
MNTTTQPDLLAAIVAATRTRVQDAKARRPASVLEAEAAARPRPRGFRAALDQPGLRVIAECKRRSPSRGVLCAEYDPVAIARRYAEAGAAAISVLTEPTFFDGALEHLAAVRAAVDLPLLRKDFIVDPYQLLEARAAGADAVLLIVAALDDRTLRALQHDAQALGLDALVEVHDEQELDRALAAGATLVGVNNRNLRTLAVDVGASERLAPRLPRDVVGVAESGLRTHEDLVRLQAAGYRAFLVGERFMTTPDPGAALRELLGQGAAA